MTINKTTKSLVEEVVRDSLKEVLQEAVKLDVKYKIGNKELDFGSTEHVKILKALLVGLKSLRDCYPTGSANRHIYALTCHKLRKLLDKYSPEK